jgi:phage tail-like protein
MARNPISDYLQVYSFWLMDLGPIDTVALPILTPLFGFSSITAPEMVMETQDIPEGNWYFDRKVLKRGSISNVTLSQGVTFFNSDFYRWMIAGVTGDTAAVNSSSFIPFLQIGGPTYRRNLLLIQYFAHTTFGAQGGISAVVAQSTLTAGIAASAAGLEGASTAGLVVSGAIAGGAAALGALNVGPFEFAARVPARAWILKGCIPVRYRPSSDFDALSGTVSVAELELAMEMFEEVALTA